MVKVLVLFYSMYGHNWIMAQHAMIGAQKVENAEVKLRKIRETLPEDVLKKMNALEPCKQWERILVASPQDLEECDVAIFATPTRFGVMCAQMKTFIDSLGGGWERDKFVGKIAGVMTSSNTQHGGQETTILSFLTALLHLGFVVGGLPYSFREQVPLDQINGCSPYGASTIAGTKQDRYPSDTEVRGAEYQAEHLTRLGTKLAK
jgi:NAD(P)H dehydrogenase (quinone)